MLDPKLVQAAQNAIAEARAEGMDADDIKWMAQGAVIRAGRDAGLIGEEVSAEMQAAISVLVTSQLKQP